MLKVKSVENSIPHSTELDIQRHCIVILHDCCQGGEPPHKKRKPQKTLKTA